MGTHQALGPRRSGAPVSGDAAVDLGAAGARARKPSSIRWLEPHLSPAVVEGHAPGEDEMLIISPSVVADAAPSPSQLGAAPPYYRALVGERGSRETWKREIES